MVSSTYTLECGLSECAYVHIYNGSDVYSELKGKDSIIIIIIICNNMHDHDCTSCGLHLISAALISINLIIIRIIISRHIHACC